MFAFLQKIGIAESISGYKVANESGIKELTMYQHTLFSQMWPKPVSRTGNDRVFVGKLVL